MEGIPVVAKAEEGIPEDGIPVTGFPACPLEPNMEVYFLSEVELFYCSVASLDWTLLSLRVVGKSLSSMSMSESSLSISLLSPASLLPREEDLLRD